MYKWIVINGISVSNKFIRLVFLFFVLLNSPLATANWNTNFIQITQGDHYKFGDKDRRLFKFLHSSSWSYGENEAFFEVINPTDDGTIVYGQYDTGLSLSKIAKRTVGIYPVVDTMPAFQIFWDELGGRDYSYGFSFYIDPPPYVKYIKTNLFLRRDTAYTGTTYSIQLTAKMLLGHDFSLNSFIDLVPKDQGEKQKNFFFKFELHYDLGQLMYKRDNIFIGLGYQYWKNKLGFKGVNERVPFFFARVYL